MAVDDDVGMEGATLAEGHVCADDAVGADVAAFGDLRAGFDDGAAVLLCCCC